MTPPPASRPVSRAEGLQATIRALSSPVRREILWMLWNGELAAGEVAAGCGLTPGTVSTHLAALRDAGLVSVRAEGTFRYYAADRDALAVALPLLATSDAKWSAADDLPERDLARASVERWVRVGVDVPLAAEAAFDAFADGARYSAWLGVPVTIEDGRFRAEMEWGTRVRGHYEVLARPDLIAMRWDFDDDLVPVPGRQLVGYLRFLPLPGGCHVEVHQAARDDAQADFLATAWSMVLGRLREHTTQEPRGPRAPRPKRRGGD